MIIKSADDKTGDLATLEALATHPNATADIRRRIEQEIRSIRAGIRGESEAAYEMEFHYGTSKNRMVLHDLRLECAGRVAQIDHLLVNRILEIYVCESKHFSEGVAVNEHGEFSGFFNGKPYGVPSPLEQNRRHVVVLASVFESGQVALPKRLGFSIAPILNSLVLVSKRARIVRPKVKVDGIETIIKNDQLKTRIDKDIDQDSNFLKVARFISPNTLEAFARELAAAHRPEAFDWAAKFGLPRSTQTQATRGTPVDVHDLSGNAANKNTKFMCASCGKRVTDNVAKFCLSRDARFGGRVLCIDCQ